MILRDLVGEHQWTGVDHDKREMPQEFGGNDLCGVISFTLDGKTYTAIEDPSDGYRSMLKTIGVSETPTTNTFAPQKVIAVMREKSKYGGSAEVLQLIDCVTGKVVLEVGTDDNDDYYPSFVAARFPENMAVNQ